MNHPIFADKQRFDKVWTWVIVIVNLPILALIAVTFYVQYFRQQATGNMIMHGSDLVIFTVVMILLTLVTTSLLLICSLRTEIHETGLRYRLYPFQLKYRWIAWSDCDRVFVRKYKPLGEYGGWGLRFSRKYGKAVNISGNYGIQCELKNGKKILVGTGQPEEAGLVLSRFFPQPPID